MSSIVADQPSARHPVLPDVRPKMLRVDVRNPDIDWLREVGAAIQRAVSLAGWSNKQAAAKIGADDAEFGKWLNGTRRPQFDKLFAVKELRRPLLIAFAELIAGDDVEVQTTVIMRRRIA